MDITTTHQIARQAEKDWKTGGRQGRLPDAIANALQHKYETHPGTIGTFTHEGKTYEIDWEEDLSHNDGRRSEEFGHIYLDGKHVGDCLPDYISKKFTSAGQVLAAAIRVIEAGDTNDQK